MSYMIKAQVVKNHYVPITATQLFGNVPSDIGIHLKGILRVTEYTNIVERIKFCDAFKRWYCLLKSLKSFVLMTRKVIDVGTAISKYASVKKHTDIISDLLKKQPQEISDTVGALCILFQICTCMLYVV